MKLKKNFLTKRGYLLDPAPDDLYFELGKILLFEDYEKALDNFKTANVINPLHEPRFNAAITLKKMGLTDEAAKLYTDAIKINPFLRETANNMLAKRRIMKNKISIIIPALNEEENIQATNKKYF